MGMCLLVCVCVCVFIFVFFINNFRIITVIDLLLIADVYVYWMCVSGWVVWGRVGNIVYYAIVA